MLKAILAGVLTVAVVVGLVLVLVTFLEEWLTPPDHRKRPPR